MKQCRFFTLALAVLALFLLPSVAQAACEASQACGGGFRVYCTTDKDYTCFTGWNYVQCDGERTYCPSLPPRSLSAMPALTDEAETQCPDAREIELPQAETPAPAAAR